MTVPVPADRSDEPCGSCRAACKTVVTDEDRKRHAHPRAFGARGVLASAKADRRRGGDVLPQEMCSSPKPAWALDWSCCFATWRGAGFARRRGADHRQGEGRVRRHHHLRLENLRRDADAAVRDLRPFCRCQERSARGRRRRSRDHSEGLSALNVPGTVTSIRQGAGPGALMSLELPVGRVLARITGGSVDAGPRAGHRLPRQSKIRRHRDRECGRRALSRRGRSAAPVPSER